MNGATVDTAGVVELFEQVLGRRPESERVVAHHLALGLDREALASLLRGSAEGRERDRRQAGLELLGVRRRGGFSEARPRGPGEPMRVLLWGAYGNGNLGDSAQAMALADLLRPLLPADAVIAASSWERRAAYEAPGGRALDPEVLLTLGRTTGNPADLLVIGGGGLFGTPHFPLHEPAWADAVVASGTPVMLLGVGGAAAALAAHARAYDVLLRHAVLVGARDVETLQAMRGVRPDAIWFPDPVLARALLTEVPSKRPERSIDTVLIPRAPNGEADARALDAMLAWRRTALTRGVNVEMAVLEPEIDMRALGARGVTAGHARHPVSWAALSDLCAQARSVVSMRLHGTIAGLEAGCQVYGLVQPKTQLLFDELGLGAWFGPDWPEAGPPPIGEFEVFSTARTAGFAAMRARLEVAIATVATALGPVIASHRTMG